MGLWNFITSILGLTSHCAYHNLTPYVEYVPGDSRLIIAVPHGGFDLDYNITRRVPGCYTDNGCDWRYNCTHKSDTLCPVRLLGDLYTIELAKLLASKYTTLTGFRPQLILNNLSRMQMDANRPRDEGTGDDEIAQKVWDDYQGYIDQAKCEVKDGLFLELHGHSHTEGYVELGYGITIDELNSGKWSAYKSTLRFSAQRTGLNIITGSYSLGNLFDESGFAAMPSPRHPKPGTNKYFRGGYNVLKHGSLHGGTVDGVQVEVPRHLRVDEEKRKEFAGAMAKVLYPFMKIRHGVTERRAGGLHEVIVDGDKGQGREGQGQGENGGEGGQGQGGDEGKRTTYSPWYILSMYH